MTGGADATALLRRSLLFLGLVTILTAWFSELFYFPDEQYQVLEFMSYRLGITPAAALPWEFAAHIRPWMQPLLYTLIAKPLLLAGVGDLFVIVFILRLLTGLLSLAALALFAREIIAGLDRAEEQRAFARALPVFGFLPYLFVRTASETLSAAFFTLGLALALRGRSPLRLLAAGCLCGLAFEARYQTALLTLGLAAWLLLVARVRAAALAGFAAGLLAALAAGALADRWGYGVWSFPAWDYFRVNILEGVAARSYGRDPVFAYLYMIPAQIFLPISLVVMASLIVMWLRQPRHALSWVTLPFVLAHVLIGHKEARFLFPLALLATAFPVLAFSAQPPRWRQWAARLWGWRRGAAASFTKAASLLAMAFLAVYPFGIRPHMPMAKYVYRHFSGGLSAYSFDAEPFQSYPMYRPAPFRMQKLGSRTQLAARLDAGPVYLFSNSPALAPDLLPPGAQARLLYSEFPLARWGQEQAGARYLKAFADFEARYPWLRLPPLYWVTLYRVTRAAAIRA